MATPDGRAADALAAARAMGRHAVRRERVIGDALLAAISDDPASAPAAAAVVAGLRAALAAASAQPEPTDPAALTADRVGALLAVASAAVTGDRAAFAAFAAAGAPAWVGTIGDALPDADADRDAFAAAVVGALTGSADDPDALAGIVAAFGALPVATVPAWAAFRNASRGSGGNIVGYAADALPIAWESREPGAVIITAGDGCRVTACYAAAGYGLPGNTRKPGDGALRNAVQDGRVPGWVAVMRPKPTGGHAWGITPDDAVPTGWAVAPPRERADADADAGSDDPDA